ncbi:hypothetical protein [Oerskovia turbata]|uniref:hypothetical protein n=1 Tax=Oerskovia turbata TaxID=1713 RepID=UPI000AEFCC17|nr:hypothetical protein [Oerskovia turbata]
MKVVLLLDEDEQLWAAASADERSRYVVQHDELAARPSPSCRSSRSSCTRSWTWTTL